jgi:hypothetical protein
MVVENRIKIPGIHFLPESEQQAIIEQYSNNIVKNRKLINKQSN